MAEKVHQGKNIKRFRELLDMKQEALALELGDDWTQKKISRLEEKEIIEPEILEQVAKALKVPVKAIEDFTEKGAATYFNTFEEGSSNQGNIGEYSTYNFNPMDKYLEAMEENKRLYEALLKSEREKITLLEKMLSEKQK